jgi:hypothetical protein
MGVLGCSVCEAKRGERLSECGRRRFSFVQKKKGEKQEEQQVNVMASNITAGQPI